MTKVHGAAPAPPFTIEEYSFVTPAILGGRYRRFCRALGLPPVGGGYGLMTCTDVDGTHWTRVTTDLAYHRMLIEAHPLLRADLDVPGEKYPLFHRGWPDEWA